MNSNNNSFWHNFSFSIIYVIQSKKSHVTKENFLFFVVQKRAASIFCCFLCFFSLHCGQKLEYFFLFLSTEFIVRHWLRRERRVYVGIIIIIRADGRDIIFFLLLLILKLNMLWMAFSIFFVKYVFVFSTTKRIFFSKKTWRFGSGDWLKNQKLGRGFFKIIID